MNREYRAVFSYPDSILGKTSDTYGPWRKTEKASWDDHVPRSEETHGWRSATQSRVIGPIETDTDLKAYQEYQKKQLEDWKMLQKRKAGY